MNISPRSRWFSALIVAAAILLSITLPAFGQTTGPWKPGLTDRPRLLWKADEWPAILSRISRQPYATLYSRVLSGSSGNPAAPPVYYDASREYGAANVAKNAAFVWAVAGDAAKAEKSATILEDLAVDFNYPDLLGMYALLDDDIHVAEAMQGYMEAFDILAGTGYLEAAREQAIHDRLETMAVNAWQFFFVDWYWYRQLGTSNNHFTKLASAFGTAAIALNDSAYATEWINQAMGWGVYKLFNDIETAEGSNAEGPSYHLYSEVNHLAFFLQYDSFTNGESATFQQRWCSFSGRNCTYTPIDVVNPLDDPRLLALAKWTVNIRMPDGTRPPFDDSFQLGGINGLLAGAWGDGEMAWDWLNAPGAPYTSSYCSDVAADLICTFDDAVTPAVPARGPNIVYPTDGYAIFRTGWTDQASYLLFLAEGGDARTNGGMHDHADTLSFLYWADGAMLAMDPGYIKWEERERVRYGIDHNVVTVDGAGPPAQLGGGVGGVDGVITRSNPNGSPPYAIAKTSYSGVDWYRGVIFYDGHILVADSIKDRFTSHTYEFLLHGNGGGDTGGTFTPLSNGALWQIGGASLTLTLSATKPITQSHHLDDHGWQYNDAHAHEVYAAAVTGTRAGFTASLVAGSKKDGVSVKALDLPKGCAGLLVRDGKFRDVLIVSDGSAVCATPRAPGWRLESGVAWIRPAEKRAVAFAGAVLKNPSGEKIVSED